MHLKNASGESLRLTIIGYQFPEITEEYYDANWLLVSIEATLDKGSCCFSKQTASFRARQATASKISSHGGRFCISMI